MHSPPIRGRKLVRFARNEGGPASGDAAAVAFAEATALRDRVQTLGTPATGQSESSYVAYAQASATQAVRPRRPRRDWPTPKPRPT